MTIPSHIVSQVSTDSDTNSRIAFLRRRTNVEQYVQNEINPIEEQILLLREQLIPRYDELDKLRHEAQSFCTHPVEYLAVIDEEGRATEYQHTEQDVTILCRFCNTKFVIVGKDDRN